ncbi:MULTISPECIES: RrF2 family transcriptional regulator [unclassified Butyrivibrio]|uniref:RrF2 family transcriptional regulator n=1 Tax=unclassified Butyrivibrio TaxID=2639466 RepID=UPI0003B6F89F|nr:MULTISPECIES: Rrf2 family transcriptional regulator [unclassified Butyrivibrio]MDC7293444.1 Rrf2 family transcriptional regulator [Butyrivibrio sp. DSM 10294]
MRISTKGRYALRVMIDLAVNDKGEFIALKDISARQNITIKYLEQIVTVLNKAGFLRSMRGNNGGHRLARAPKDYVVGDILRVMEGNLSPVECAAKESGVECPLSDNCVTLSFWQGLDKVVNDYVDKFTLEDLVVQYRRGESD